MTLLTTTPEPLATPADDLRRVLQLYESGLCLQAYEVSKRLGPLHSWQGTAALIVAGRMAPHLGAPKLGFRLIGRAWRNDRNHPEACYYHAWTLLSRRGPLRALEFVDHRGDWSDATDEVRADVFALRGSVLSHVRDFEAAESWLKRADAICPERAWIAVEWARVYQNADRFADALAAARRALELRPWFRPAVLAVASALLPLNRDDEALDLLTQANERLESEPIAIQLAALQDELGHYADARRTFARCADLSPLVEPELEEWLAARRSDAAYYDGDFAEAVAFARRAKDPFYDAFADRLEQMPTEHRRMRLPVGFVRQHHQTCAPATLSAISRFWDMPVDHLEVASAICYDGTPDHRERRWAEEHGWVAREFTVTWDAAVALIDRSIPFTLTTVEPTGGHLQAAIGYDGHRGTLLVRDPSLRHSGEWVVAGMLERYRSTGPRGMALVPRERADLLNELDLPDAEQYDHIYRLQRALQGHDRDGAAAALEALHMRWPDHRLTWQGRRILASYDADRVELLACAEGLLSLFPDDPLWQLMKLGCLRDLTRRVERLALLKSICDKHGADPVFCRQLAQELFIDGREQTTVEHLLRRALRFRPTDPPALAILGNLRMDQRRFDEATSLYRFAACLDDKDEGLARSYFGAARYSKRGDEALRFLRARVDRFGDLSGLPVRTLVWALELGGKMDEGAALLDGALRRRPDDGDLRLVAAESLAEQGDFARADALIGEAEGHCHPTPWLRASARLAVARGDRAAALPLWKKVVEAEPFDVESNRWVAQLLLEAEGRDASRAHFEAFCARFPHHHDLHQAWVEWLRDDGPEAQEPVLRRLVELHPADPWARRELAFALALRGRHDEAREEIELAVRLEPEFTGTYSVLGRVHALAGRVGNARESYRRAIALSVDNGFAVARLMETCESRTERKEALAFVWNELVRQVTFGDGLLAFQDHARDVLDPEELLSALREGLQARPDLWHAWSAVIRQLVDLKRFDEADDLARQATERFPLLAKLWHDRALVCRAWGNRNGEIDALKHALQIQPGWSHAARSLAEAYEREAKYEQSRALLEDAVTRAPLDPLNHGWLADALWHLGRHDEAIDHAKRAIQLDPDYDWAWNALSDWLTRLGQADAIVEFAHELAAQRGNEVRPWLRLVEALDRPDALEERLAALDRALAIDPRCDEAFDRKAELLAGVGRLDEARAACHPPGHEGRVPVILRGRAAWIEATAGDVEGAVAQMRGVLADDPDYSWGWHHLASWCRRLDRDAEYLEASEAMVRLAPESAVCLGYRGEARLRTGDSAGAKEDFRKALSLAPGYIYASLSLFDMELEAREFDAAEQTLQVMEQQGDDPFVLARRAQISCARGTAIAALSHCARSPKVHATSIGRSMPRSQPSARPGWPSSRTAFWARWSTSSPPVHGSSGSGWTGVTCTSIPCPSRRLTRSSPAAARTRRRCWRACARLVATVTGPRSSGALSAIATGCTKTRVAGAAWVTGSLPWETSAARCAGTRAGRGAKASCPAP